MADKTDKHLNKEKKRSRFGFRWSRVLTLVVVFSFTVAIAILGYGYFVSSKMSVILARQLEQVEKIIENDHQQLALIQQNVQKFEKIVQKTEELSAQQEKLINDWQAAQKGDMTRWQLAEAMHLVKLANQKVVFQSDFRTAAYLLQQAEQRLQPVHGLDVVAIRRSIANDLKVVQQTPVINQQKLYLELVELGKILNQLPFGSAVMPEQQAEAARQSQDAEVKPWWHTGWDKSWQALKQIIVVKQLDAHAIPLTMPEEKIFLTANLQSKLDSAMWAVLHRDDVVYKKALEMTVTWITQYFDLQAPQTKLALERLQALRQLNVSSPDVNFARTLQLFDEIQASKGAV